MMRHTCTEVSQVSGLVRCARDILDTCVEYMNAILLFDLLHTQAVIRGNIAFSTYSRCWPLERHVVSSRLEGLVMAALCTSLEAESRPID
jgi:hypothetical protein